MASGVPFSATECEDKAFKKMTLTFYHDPKSNKCHIPKEEAGDFVVLHSSEYSSKTSQKHSTKRQLGVRVNSAEIAKPFRDEIASQVAKMVEAGGSAPLLVGLLANEDPSAKKYAQWIERSCKADGLRYELRECLKDSLVAELTRANEDTKVHGIIVFYPVFGSMRSFSGNTMDDDVRNTVSVEKDVEGLTFKYRDNLYRNVRFMDNEKLNKAVIPCTPLAVVKIIDHLGYYNHKLPERNRLRGVTVTIVNRSDIVGRPLAAMLAHDGADVYSVDIENIFFLRGLEWGPTETDNRSAYKKSNIIITGVPNSSFRVPLDCVSEGTTMINVAGCKNAEVTDFLEIPGTKYVSSIGKVTVSMLERNLLRLYDQYHCN